MTSRASLFNLAKSVSFFGLKGQGFDNPELSKGQIDGLTFPVNQHTFFVDLERPYCQVAFRSGLGLELFGDPEEGVYTCDQKLQADRLGDVIPCSHSLRGDTVGIAVAGGKKDNWEGGAQVAKLHA